MVADIVARYSDPLEACKSVVAAAYDLWLQFEDRTDDITIIIMFIDEVDEYLSSKDSFYDKDPATDAMGYNSNNTSGYISHSSGRASPMQKVLAEDEDVLVTSGSSSSSIGGIGFMGGIGGEGTPVVVVEPSKPVRRAFSREKKKNMIQLELTDQVR
jgi:hypothetical protein